MAHFAEVDANGVVVRVLVINNADITNLNGEEQEHLGKALLSAGLPGSGLWVQTSYNGNFRVRYAGPGMTYNANADAFIQVKPYESWVLSAETHDGRIWDWDAPVPHPEWPPVSTTYVWNEDTVSWEAMTAPE
jgi:hypothetical protein